MMTTEAATRVDEVYDPPNALEFGVWTASMGQLTSNPDGWEKFFLTIRQADPNMVLFIENFKACLHSQVQQAAQEAGLVVRESLRTRTLPRRTPIKRARAPLCAVKDDTFSSHASNPYPIRIPTTLTLPPALHTGRVHGQHPQLPHSDRGAPLGLQGRLAAVHHTGDEEKPPADEQIVGGQELGEEVREHAWARVHWLRAQHC